MATSRGGPLPLHPMTLSDILDGSFKLLRASARTVLTVTAVFVVPIQVVAAWLQRDILGGESISEFLQDPTVSSDRSGGGDIAATVFALAAQVLVLPFVAGAISRVVAAAYLGEQLDAGPALRSVASRWWALTAGWILVHLFEGAVWIVVAVLAVGMVVADSTGTGPVLVFAVLGLAGAGWALAAMALSVAVAPAIVVEELRPVAGLRRSIALTRRRLFPVLGIALAGGLLANILGQVLGVVPQVLGLAVGADRGGWVLIAAGGVLTSLISTPLIAIISTLVYFDGRMRTEGFDLEIMALEMARGGAR